MKLIDGKCIMMILACSGMGKDDAGTGFGSSAVRVVGTFGKDDR